MKTVFKQALYLIVLSCLTETAIGDSPREDFESDAVLSAAMSEINQLNLDQLEAVVDYIANCIPAPDPLRDFECERAREIVEIKTSQAIAFGNIRLAVWLIDQVIPWEKSDVSEQVNKDISRRVKVFSKLRSATSERYQILISE